jgi:DNA-binding NarL/FixJ family response regulator
MKVLIVDDHTLFADGLAYMLERMDQALIVLKAGNCREAFQQADEHSDIKLVLLDLGLPDMSGFDALPVFRERYPDTPVVVLSGRDDRESVLKALDIMALQIALFATSVVNQ